MFMSSYNAEHWSQSWSCKGQSKYLHIVSQTQFCKYQLFNIYTLLEKLESIAWFKRKSSSKCRYIRCLMQKKLLENPHDDHLFWNIVTCDEKWVCLNNPGEQNQWLDCEQTAKLTTKWTYFFKKTLFCFGKFWVNSPPWGVFKWSHH